VNATLAVASPDVPASEVGGLGGETTVKPFHGEVNPVAVAVLYTVGSGVGRDVKSVATVGAFPKNLIVCNLDEVNAAGLSTFKFDGSVMLVYPPP
jgi:hypothetical protein